LAEEPRPVEPVAGEELAGAAGAQARRPDVSHGHARFGHFLPPLTLIGVVSRSPYHRMFGPVIQTSPNTTGMARPSSAVGKSKSSSVGLGGCAGLGASA